MADSSLVAIQTLTRRLTRSPSTSQLSDYDLNQFINTFVLYDFPEQLRLFNLRTLLTFYTQPGVDEYATNTTNPLDPLYNFKNKYIAVHPPVYLAGIQGFYTQWRDVFYGYYPQTQTIADTQLRGDGTSGPFAGKIVASPSIQRSINFNCLDTTGTAMVLTDSPLDNVNGILGQLNYLTNSFIVYGSINYITGAYSLVFPNPTLVAAPIWVENIAYQPGKPLAVLYYDDKFTIRPVPDKVYTIEFEVDIQPTELLATNQSPDLQQWWQYIAYGAAKKIFESRMDMESVQLIMPEFKQQERFVLRSTLTQQANERTVTIYTQGKNYGFGWFGNGGWPY
jgi:hypothetical protein